MANEARSPTLTEKAEAAFQQAATRVIERARQTGTPVITWEGGHIAQRSGDELDALQPRTRQAARPHDLSGK